MKSPFPFLPLLATLLPVAAQIPAFPGAQGFGAYATGGRGGDVYYVTNLNGSGAGSLRNGVDTAPASGRTIVFSVSGYIPLPGASAFRLVQNKITIAGQTAPGDGIGLRNGTVRVTGNNAVLRHLRLRHGRNGSGGDCLLGALTGGSAVSSGAATKRARVLAPIGSARVIWILSSPVTFSMDQASP